AGQVEFHSLRQEFFDTETKHGARRFVGRIGAQFERPGSCSRVVGYLDVFEVVAAITRVGLPRGRELLMSRGILERRLNGLCRNGPAIRIASQHRNIEGLTGPIKITYRIGE